MLRSFVAALGMIAGLAGHASSQSAPDNPVVVELYTSQGCSSCPPADDILAELADRDDVLALALHVDYWDYIGWADSFGDPNYTKRQKAYARAAGAKSIYTPQMIVQGMDHLVGVQPMELADLIRSHAARPARVQLRVRRDGGRLVIEARAEPPLTRGAMVQLVRFLPEATVAIERGENAGRTLTYYNIVRSWQALGEWDGRSDLHIEADDAQGEGQRAVIVQEAGPGPILAAARLR